MRSNLRSRLVRPHLIVPEKKLTTIVVPHMVRANNGFQTWHLMQTISALAAKAKCICDVKIINSRPLCVLFCLPCLAWTFFGGWIRLKVDTMLKTFHEAWIIIERQCRKATARRAVKKTGARAAKS